MQRFVNGPDMTIDDMLKGYVKRHKDILHISGKDDHVVVENRQKKYEVGIVSGGGGGHEPYFLGYVDGHMLDAIVVEEILSSPPATAFHQAFLEVDTDAGVACLFDDCAGDNMNTKMAVQMATMQ